MKLRLRLALAVLTLAAAYGDSRLHDGSRPKLAVQSLFTAADFDAFLDNDDAGVVGFFEPATGEAQRAYETFARKQSKYRWAVTNSAPLLQQHRLTNALVVFKSSRFVSTEHGDKLRARYPSSSLAHETALLDFIASHSQPLVGMLSPNSQDFYDSMIELPLLTLFCEPDFTNNPKNSRYYLNRLRKAAVKFKGRLVFAMASKQQFGHQLADYGTRIEDGWDAVGVGIKHTEWRSSGLVPSYYWMHAGFSIENLLLFCQDYLDGKLTTATHLGNPEYDTLSTLDPVAMARPATSSRKSQDEEASRRHSAVDL